MLANQYGYFPSSGVYSQNTMYPGTTGFGTVPGNTMMRYPVPQQMKDNRKPPYNYYAPSTSGSMGEEFYGIPSQGMQVRRESAPLMML